jgi:hypothetical protein
MTARMTARTTARRLTRRTARRTVAPRRHRLSRAGLTAATVLVLATACGSGSDGADAAGAASPPDSTVTSAPSGTTEPTPSDSPTTSARPSATPYPTTTTAHVTPWTDKNADFGYVSKAKVVSGGVQFSFDRATWLLASQVAAWNKANPTHQVEQADDYAIGNISTRLRTFVVVTGAKIFGSIILSDQPESKRITAAQFVSRLNASPEPVTCWLFHQYGGLTGNVVQLEEQYRP